MVAKISQLIAVLYLFCAVVSAQPTSRIVGGVDAYIGQFPHQVALFIDGSFNCGGSIISSRYVLTAAHCVGGLQASPPSSFTLRVGSIQRSSGGKLVFVKRVIVRPTYGNFLDDVALLELQQELVFTNEIKPIDLFDGEVPLGQAVVVSGWGRLSNGGAIPNRLQYTTLNALDGDACNNAIGWGYEQIICLAHPKDKGACNGDSGGPATYEGKLVGVAGFVVSGCGSVYPDGYAKVSYHREWILQNIY